MLDKCAYIVDATMHIKTHKFEMVSNKSVAHFSAKQLAEALIDCYLGQAVACCDENSMENYELPFSLSTI